MKDEEKTIEQIITELDDMERKAAGTKSKEQNNDSEEDVTFAEEKSQQLLGELRESKTSDESAGHSGEQDMEEHLEEITSEEPFEELFKEKGSLQQPQPEVPAEDLIREEFNNETVSEGSFDQMFSEESSEKPGGEPPQEPPIPPGKRVSMTISRLMVFFGIIVLVGILSALFIYPTMYEHRSMKYGDKTYPVKINRITQSVQYYDEGEWRSKPLTRISPYRGSVKVNKENHQAASYAAQEALHEASLPKVLPETSTTIPVETSPEIVVKTPANTAVVTPADVSVKMPEVAHTVTPGETRVSGGESLAKREPEKTAKVTEKRITEQKLISQDEKRTKANKETDVITQEEPYTIQISSMRSLILAKMLLKDLKKKGMDAFMHKFETRNQGVWHVIFIGHFTDSGTAVMYMKKEKIKDTYPGSLVRKAPRYASDIRK